MSQPTDQAVRKLKRPRSAVRSTVGVEEEAVAPSASPAVAPSSSAPNTNETVPSRDRSLLQDPIYRIMRRTPRSDMIEVVRCRFGREHCERAAAYFDDYFMRNPLRYVRLQLGCSGPTGLHLFFPRLAHHRFTLRTLDLSRNELTADDVTTLCQGLALDGATQTASPDGGETRETHALSTSCLEVLDLSYNTKIGNTGAVQLLHMLRHNSTIKAVLLRCVGVDDGGAAEIAKLLRLRPNPRRTFEGAAPGEAGFTSSFFADASRQREPGFLLNLNENRIGAAGTVVLGKGLPSYVSLSLCKQRVRPSHTP